MLLYEGEDEFTRILFETWNISNHYGRLFFFLPLSIFQYSLKAIRENKEKDLNVEFQLHFLKKLLNTA